MPGLAGWTRWDARAASSSVCASERRERGGGGRGGIQRLLSGSGHTRRVGWQEQPLPRPSNKHSRRLNAPPFTVPTAWLCCPLEIPDPPHPTPTPTTPSPHRHTHPQPPPRAPAVDDWLREKLAESEEELRKERDCVGHLIPGAQRAVCAITEDTMLPGEPRPALPLGPP